MAQPRRRVRDAMRELEDAVVCLHDAEERACGRRVASQTESQFSVSRARVHLEGARAALQGLSLTPDERGRADALLDTVGLLLALREAAGGASLAARFLS